MYEVFLRVPSTSRLAEAFHPARLSDTERLMLSFLFHARASPRSLPHLFVFNPHSRPGFCMNLLTSDPFVGCARGDRHEGEQREGERWQRGAHDPAARQD